MSINKLIILFFLTLLFSCDQQEKKEKVTLLQDGIWRMEMTLNAHTLPFNFLLNRKKGNYEMTILNSEERIFIDSITVINDSIFIKLPVFESEFFLSIVDQKTLKGVWLNYYKGDDYKVPVIAHHGIKDRFAINKEEPVQNFEGKYEVVFGKDADQYNAIGLFEQRENNVTGTFATETGDYRYLEGVTYGDSLFLSTFDGSHAFLFKAKKTDSIIDGVFLSGIHFKESWTAKKNDLASLRNPDSLTFLKDGFEKLSFELENTKGKLISLDDEQYDDKVIIVQIMGTWCPNCLDETRYLTDLYSNYKEKGLEIVALAFERTKTKEKAIQNINALKDKTKADYEILLGGSTRKEKATEVLPMLNHIMSYPTAIFIDREKNIRKIHTGFYGPGTGEYYNTFVSETEELIQHMLAE